MTTLTQSIIPPLSRSTLGPHPVKQVLRKFFNFSHQSDLLTSLFLPKIIKTSHIGFCVQDISSVLKKLQTQYPKRNYHLIRSFNSVSIPKLYDGSTAVIAQIQSSNPTYPSLELFCVNWQGKYRLIDLNARYRLIQHIALETTNHHSIQLLVDQTSSLIYSDLTITPIHFNPISQETFCYLTNPIGNKIELLAKN